MREPAEIVAAFPRPGRTLKVLLAIVAVFALAGAVIVNWAPGGDRGIELFRWLAFEPGRPFARPWTLLTSGVLTSPEGISHALWSLLGLYFLTPDLEKRWGGARLVRFLLTAVLLGNLMVLAGSYVLPDRNVFRPGLVFGPIAAVTAAVIAWSKENAHRQIRFMFFLPMSGKTLYWLTIGLAFISLVFLQGTHEGGLAPIGGILTGTLFAGSPSPVRALWLRFRLGSLQKRRGGITVDELLGDDPPSRPRPKRGGKAPPLRVVQGGLEDDLKNRKPPKDKRYLN
ncbi:MAG: rhomboid family intramembrane serine protease [Labilithrix sp.]|nr:rhomboid family intramembrane serine protease [Labilithrix sp.]MBX3211501.1 rhomboid family intramembrane serine protease [Labilithrix sp.]